jgi:hypothetical protein
MAPFKLFNHRRNIVILSITVVAAILIIWTCKKTEVEPPANSNSNPVPSNSTTPTYTPGSASATINPHSASGGLPHPDHIIFCFFENKNFTQLIGNTAQAPYINSLRAQGTLFTNSYAISHPSYPEYILFFAGTPNGVADDNCINTSDWTIPNLFTQLATVNKTFAWYSEDLPAAGSTVCTSGSYAEKHNPTTLFANVPASANKPFAAFPGDYNTLENVVCISPNLIDDMHDGTINQGDAWLQRLSPLIDWCKTHNSIFVVYYDEDNGQADNRIPVIAVGQHVKPNFELATRYDHYNWTRTACSMFNAPNDWTSNLVSHTDISGCWQ